MKKILSILLLIVAMPVQALDISIWPEALKQQSKPVMQEKNFEILFFYLSNCQYCHRLSPILEAESAAMGAEVKGISANDRPIEPGKKYYLDYELIGELNVNTYPSVYLLDKDTNRAFEITRSFINQAELGKRLSLAIMQAQEG